jgi:hypothetical protein
VIFKHPKEIIDELEYFTAEQGKTRMYRMHKVKFEFRNFQISFYKNMNINQIHFKNESLVNLYTLITIPNIIEFLVKVV